MFDHDAGPSPTLEEAITELDPLVALMSLVHLTGDRSLLDLYGPALEGTQKVVRAEFVPSAKGREVRVADEGVVSEIQARLLEMLQTNATPLLRTPDSALFQKMTRLCLGFTPAQASLELARQQAGFLVDTRVRRPRRAPPEDFKVLVIGAGMVGINAAIKLKEAGFNYTVLESRHEVGGTWSINRYPGAAVDTPSMQYSFSFDLNPSWTKYYPRGPEYLAYIKRVVERHHIADRIHFNTAMTGATWDEARKLWVVRAVQDGAEQVYEAHVVIPAVGVLNRPKKPPIENREAFKGSIVHSAEWEDSIDLDGKEVTLVGVGCTGVQIAAAIADRVKSLTIIQRQPEWIVPNAEVLASVPTIERWQMENIPYVAQWKRMQSIAPALKSAKGMLVIDPEWRAETGGVSRLNDMLCDIGRDYVRASFADRPDLVEKLIPSYPYFAKRPIMDCGYFAALKKPNVRLVVGELAACEPEAVVLRDGAVIESQVLILATGFHLDFLTNFDIKGRDGKRLREAWSPYPYAYQGMLAPSFPNFFFTCGPHSLLASAHSTLGEQQVHYIVELLQTMIDENLAAAEISEAACADFNRDINALLDRTVWVNKGDAHGYYRHESGRVVLGYPRHNSLYWQELRSPVAEHFILTPREDPVEPERDRALET